MGRTFYVENLGCAKNQVDAEYMIAALRRRGWRLADGPEEASLLIVNTCGFVEPARRESIETGLALRNRFPKARILFTGCLSQRYGEELARELPEIDAFLGNRDPCRVVDLAEPGEGVPRVLCPQPARRRPPRRQRLLSFPGSAYLKVSEGCDNRCSYCAIPLIRGPLASRAIDEILGEARRLVEGGIREIVLVALDLGSFGRDRGRPELAALLRELSMIPGDFWIRMLYIHPDRFPLDILPILRDEPRLLPYFDVPFQHASPRILAAMNRRPRPEENLRLLERIRAELPAAVIRSTFLVGFPGEDDDDFGGLIAFQDAAALDWLGVFAWSREEGTAAYGLAGRVPAKVAARRKAALEERQVPITSARLDRQVGAVADVLIEEPIQGEDLALGRAWLQAPDVDGLVVVRGTAEPGAMVRVLIDRRNGFDLEGAPAAGPFPPKAAPAR